jgi:ADP-heptose:LPS heptosyltransferase
MIAYPRHILVIKLGALGDFIQSLGPMAAIRAHHPHDRMTLLTTAPFESIARASGYFDDIQIDTRPKFFDVKGWLGLRRKLNGGNFSRVYDLQNNDRTSFYFKLFTTKPEWSGVAHGASHRNISPERTAGRAFYGHVQTLGLAGINGVSIDTMAWMKAQDSLPSLPAPYVLIVAGSAPSHPQKRWPVKHYSEFCARLVAQGYHPVLIGSGGEADTLAALHAAVPQSINLCGKTILTDLPALARGAYGAVGNDTGPMHLIAPTGCPSIVLFSGSSNPARHAPLGHNVVTIQKDVLGNVGVGEVWNAFEIQHKGTA